MKKNFYSMCLIIAFYSSAIYSSPPCDYLTSLYCLLFGSEDASPKYQQLVHTALRDYGIENPEDVPVKRMNYVAPFFIGDQLCSFTTTGIWLNEEIINQCTWEKIIFIIYHEAAHYKLRHHKRLLSYLFPIAATILCLPYISKKLIGTDSHISATLLAELSLIMYAKEYMIEPLLTQQEDSANNSAANKIVLLNKNGTLDRLMTIINQQQQMLSQ